MTATRVCASLNEPYAGRERATGYKVNTFQGRTHCQHQPVAVVTEIKSHKQRNLELSLHVERFAVQRPRFLGLFVVPKVAEQQQVDSRLLSSACYMRSLRCVSTTSCLRVARQSCGVHSRLSGPSAVIQHTSRPLTPCFRRQTSLAASAGN